MTIDHSITHIRPRFEFIVPSPKAEVIEKIRKVLDNSPPHIIGNISRDHIILDISQEEVHYWSPQLNFRVEDIEDEVGKSKIAGLIGPRPNVWTLFVFIYFSVGIISFFITSYGMSKYMLGDYTHLVWAFPLGIIFMLTAYKAGKMGEKLGHDQTEMFKDFLRKVLKVEQDIHTE